MSDIDGAIQSYNKFVGGDAASVSGQIGISAAQSALSLSFPNDFEYYMVALELVDFNGNTIDYFVFPINPSTYNQDEPSITNIRKTMGGVSAVGNSSFVPIPIRMAGNFGRKFKVLVGSSDNVTPSVAQYSTTNGVFSKEGFIQNTSGKFIKTVSNTRVKTGYGATKILQAICDKSRGDLGGKPNQLYMYNPAFNANFLVKVNNVSFSQSSQGGNFIWNYELSMTAIAPLEVVIGSADVKKTLSGTLVKGFVQSSANLVLRSANNILNRR